MKSQSRKTNHLQLLLIRTTPLTFQRKSSLQRKHKKRTILLSTFLRRKIRRQLQFRRMTPPNMFQPRKTTLIKLKFRRMIRQQPLLRRITFQRLIPLIRTISQRLHLFSRTAPPRLLQSPFLLQSHKKRMNPPSQFRRRLRRKRRRKRKKKKRRRRTKIGKRSRRTEIGKRRRSRKLNQWKILPKPPSNKSQSLSKRSRRISLLKSLTSKHLSNLSERNPLKRLKTSPHKKQPRRLRISRMDIQTMKERSDDQTSQI